MYTRSFYDSGHTIPDGYDGEALRENDTSEVYTIQPTGTEKKVSPTTQEYDPPEENNEYTGAFSFGGILSGIQEAFPFKRFFKDMNIGAPKSLDIEEIILIGIAILLFFSECGDKLLALLLIGLLFISK